MRADGDPRRWRRTAAPAESTTDRNARFSWSISGNDAGESPFCVLDMTEISGTEVPCSATGTTRFFQEALQESDGRLDDSAHHGPNGTGLGTALPS